MKRNNLLLVVAVFAVVVASVVCTVLWVNRGETSDGGIGLHPVKVTNQDSLETVINRLEVKYSSALDSFAVLNQEYKILKDEQSKKPVFISHEGNPDSNYAFILSRIGAGE